MSAALKAACIQLGSGADIARNLEGAGVLVREAASRGAQLILTPEVTDQVVSNRAEKLHETLTQEEHPGVPFFSALAKELNITLIIGSMAIKVAKDKIANRSFAFGPDGGLLATYDKIHLYDVDLPSGESHRESRIFTGGDRAAVIDTPAARIGLSICYDLRFAYLYRDLAKAGAQILTIPAAFTVPTGRAHWEVLLRARAIETGSFVLAAAQSGDHEGARSTYGHSMIISPWGDILAQRSESGPGIVMADIRLEDVEKVRASIPALQHDRAYTKP